VVPLPDAEESGHLFFMDISTIDDAIVRRSYLCESSLLRIPVDARQDGIFCIDL